MELHTNVIKFQISMSEKDNVKVITEEKKTEQFPDNFMYKLKVGRREKIESQQNIKDDKGKNRWLF